MYFTHLESHHILVPFFKQRFRSLTIIDWEGLVYVWSEQWQKPGNKLCQPAGNMLVMASFSHFWQMSCSCFQVSEWEEWRLTAHHPCHGTLPHWLRCFIHLLKITLLFSQLEELITLMWNVYKGICIISPAMQLGCGPTQSPSGSVLAAGPLWWPWWRTTPTSPLPAHRWDSDVLKVYMPTLTYRLTCPHSDKCYCLWAWSESSN